VHTDSDLAPDSPAADSPAPDLDAIRDQVMTAAAAASDKLASDIVILEVGPLVGITDFFLVLSTSNDRQLSSAVDEVEHQLRTAHRRKPIGREGEASAGWVVLDYGDFVVHAFTAAQRSVYDLERLWSDAPRTEFVDAPA
jgi:ribosome-associated protein